jgi:hypothetical protein
LALLSVVFLATVAGTLVLADQLNVKADTDSTSTVTTDNTDTTTATSTANDNSSTTNVTGYTDFGRGWFREYPRGMGHAFGGFGAIQVSDEFKQNVNSIAQADSDVQNLLNTGYNVTSVTPILGSTVNANGNVVTKASSAILTLEKDTTGRATVLVDMDQAKVTKIYIETRTLIKK